MTVGEGVSLLEEMARKKQLTIPLYVGIAKVRL